MQLKEMRNICADMVVRHSLQFEENLLFTYDRKIS